MFEAIARPLASQRLAHSADVEELRRTISGITRNAHHQVLSRGGETTGDVAGLRLGGFGLASVAYDRPTTIVTEPVTDRLVAIVPLAPMRVAVGERRWQGAAPFLLSNAAPTRFEVPRAGGIAVSFDLGVLEAQLSELGLKAGAGRLVLGSEATGRLVTGPRAFNALVLEACRVIDDGTAAGPLGRATLEAILASAIVVGLRDSFARPSAPPRAARSYFRDAVRMLEENYAEPLTLGEVAAAVCISERHLHTVFVEHAGMSAARFLRQTRLKKARELLTDPEQTNGLTIAAVAKRVGMSHTGRFAAAYAAEFGEQPSDTRAATKYGGTDATDAASHGRPSGQA